MKYEIGDLVTFGKRRGYVRGYSTLKRQSSADKYETYLIVELDFESSAYLERRGIYEHDCFITFMLIHPQSVQSHNGREIYENLS